MFDLVHRSGRHGDDGRVVARDAHRESWASADASPGPHIAIIVSMAALGLVWSPGYAQETIKATLLKDNTIQLDTSRVKAGSVVLM